VTARAVPAAAPAPALRITEIFLSLQGESVESGWPTVFVRLTGCPLRCRYCDTAYAFHGGTLMSLEAIEERVRSHGVPRVCVTGGEPLGQPAVHDLLRRLCDAGYGVVLETGGALSIAGVDPRVVRVLDFKTPGSGEEGRNLYANVAALRPADQVKIVLTDRTDYLWALDLVRRHRLAERATVWFSPAWGALDPRRLAAWILEDRAPVRLQLQIHKILWGEEPGR
jgi:7-carboxy-7-deazaguanine synthase